MHRVVRPLPAAGRQCFACWVYCPCPRVTYLFFFTSANPPRWNKMFSKCHAALLLLNYRAFVVLLLQRPPRLCWRNATCTTRPDGGSIPVFPTYGRATVRTLENARCNTSFQQGFLTKHKHPNEAATKVSFRAAHLSARCAFMDQIKSSDCSSQRNVSRENKRSLSAKE